MGVRIHVGATPVPFEGTARYVDADRATVMNVTLRVEDQPAPGVLQILAAEASGTTAGTELARWPLQEIRRLRDQADPALLALKHAGLDRLERLYIDDADTSQRLLARCPVPERAERAVPRGRIARWALGAVAAVALILFVLVPNLADQLARMLPAEGEKALGVATLEQIRNALSDDPMLPVAFCESPQGDAALAAMAARLTLGLDLPQPLSLHVLDDPMVNAFALPGGTLVFFRGMIEAAEHPDEIAAVMAHELGHVVSRDPARHALRSAGSIGVLGLLLGDFAGGAVVLFLAEQLISAKYSQEAELAADRFGLERMVAAGLDTEQMALMFERLQAEEAAIEEEQGGAQGAGLLRYFLSHPQTGDRIDAIRAAAPGGDAAAPSLDAAQWQALQEICGPRKPDPEEG